MIWSPFILFWPCSILLILPVPPVPRIQLYNAPGVRNPIIAELLFKLSQDHFGQRGQEKSGNYLGIVPIVRLARVSRLPVIFGWFERVTLCPTVLYGQNYSTIYLIHRKLLFRDSKIIYFKDILIKNYLNCSSRTTLILSIKRKSVIHSLIKW